MHQQHQLSASLTKLYRVLCCSDLLHGRVHAADIWKTNIFLSPAVVTADETARMLQACLALRSKSSSLLPCDHVGTVSSFLLQALQQIIPMLLSMTRLGHDIS